MPERFDFVKPALPRPREHEGRVTGKRWLSDDTLELAFQAVPAAAPGPEDFLPGQYMSIVLPAEEPPGSKRDLRPYSLWNHPAERVAAQPHRFTTVARIVEGGRATGWMRDVEIGASFRFVGPLGTFFLRRPLHPHLYFVATGTGLVPLRCMVREMIETGEIAGCDTTLIFGVRSQKDLFGIEDLQRWSAEHPRFRFVPMLSRPEPGWSGAKGRVTRWLEEATLPVDSMQAYLCGNGAMIDDVIGILEARGLDRRSRRIVHEKYFE
jgi:CDP-4-dehydro-6-deoxyglucose reductase